MQQAKSQNLKLRQVIMRRRVASEKGTTLIEFAIVMVVLMTILFGIMDFARAMYIYHFVSEVAREATRYAIVRGSTFKGTACATTATVSCQATAANVTSYVQGLTPAGINTGWITGGCPSTTNPCVATTWLTTTPTGTACVAEAPGCMVEVQVTYPFKFILPYLPKTIAPTFSSTSEMVISE